MADPAQNTSEFNVIKRAYDREKQARLQAEELLETKTYDLYVAKELVEKNLADLEKKTAEIKELNLQVADVARSAGMADVATSMLHNIGNVLNSASVSLEVIEEKANSFNFSRLADIADLLLENMENIQQYLSSDAKGRLILNYIKALSGSLEAGRSEQLKELRVLGESMRHIKEIVISQNAISRSAGIVEKVFIVDIINNAIQMTDLTKVQHKVGIGFENDCKQTLFLDKGKFLQILINLIQNAKDSIVARNLDFKEDIKITCMANEKEKLIEIKITDFGMGIAPGDMNKIFQFGFSTKEHGHGFGLHSSALAAKEMGGELSVSSEGPGKGATFTLTLPLKSA